MHFFVPQRLQINQELQQSIIQKRNKSRSPQFPIARPLNFVSQHILKRLDHYKNTACARARQSHTLIWPSAMLTCLDLHTTRFSPLPKNCIISHLLTCAIAGLDLKYVTFLVVVHSFVFFPQQTLAYCSHVHCMCPTKYFTKTLLITLQLLQKLESYSGAHHMFANYIYWLLCE